MSQRRDRETEEQTQKHDGPNAPHNTSSAASSNHHTVITFVTGNAGKLSEVNAMLAKVAPPLRVSLTNNGVDLPELQGQPEDIAREKAKTAFRLLGNKPCLVEDTSLCFNALGQGKLPGPYIRDFLNHLGLDGLNKILVGFNDTRAYAQCIFALAMSEDDVRLFVGRCYGNIVPKRGETGFGWDPVFEPTEGGVEDGSKGSKTFADMSKEEKNEISHRRRALDKLVEFFKTL